MFSFRFRVAAGICALAVAGVACWLLVRTGRPVVAALFAPAAILALPLFASTHPPRVEELPALNENVMRFRTAGLICFTVAVLINLASHDSNVAALGVAWWAVGFGLIPFALYFASRRAMLEDESRD
jgi:hypothetical protein